MLENTEGTIHRAVRKGDNGARPPMLSVARSGKEVLITYSSTRQMCGIAIGIIRGLSTHYSEPIQLEELTCMAYGAGSCRIAVKREALRSTA